MLVIAQLSAAWMAFSHCGLTWWTGWELFWGSFIRALVPFMRAAPLWPHHSPNASSLNIILRVRISTYQLKGEHKPSIYNRDIQFCSFFHKFEGKTQRVGGVEERVKGRLPIGDGVRETWVIACPIEKVLMGWRDGPPWTLSCPIGMIAIPRECKEIAPCQAHRDTWNKDKNLGWLF